MFIENYNENQSNISKAYFVSKEFIPRKDFAYFFKKIMNEIILINQQMVKISNTKIKKREKYKEVISYINNFLSKKNLKNVLIKAERKKEFNNKLIFSEKNKKYNQFKKDTEINFFRNDLNNDLNSTNNNLAYSQDYSIIKTKLNTKIEHKNKYINNFKFKERNNIKDDIFITNILFFLSIEDLFKFSMVNKLFYKLMKIHISK